MIQLHTRLKDWQLQRFNRTLCHCCRHLKENSTMKLWIFFIRYSLIENCLFVWLWHVCLTLAYLSTNHLVIDFVQSIMVRKYHKTNTQINNINFITTLHKDNRGFLLLTEVSQHWFSVWNALISTWNAKCTITAMQLYDCYTTVLL